MQACAMLGRQASMKTAAPLSATKRGVSTRTASPQCAAARSSPFIMLEKLRARDLNTAPEGNAFIPRGCSALVLQRSTSATKSSQGAT